MIIPADKHCSKAGKALGTAPVAVLHAYLREQAKLDWKTEPGIDWASFPLPHIHPAGQQFGLE